MYFRTLVFLDYKRWIPLSRSSMNLTASRMYCIHTYKQPNEKYCICIHVGRVDLSLNLFKSWSETERFWRTRGRRDFQYDTHCKLEWENLISNWHIKCVQFNFIPKTICPPYHHAFGYPVFHCQHSHWNAGNIIHSLFHELMSFVKWLANLCVEYKHTEKRRTTLIC